MRAPVIGGEHHGEYHEVGILRAGDRLCLPEITSSLWPIGAGAEPVSTKYRKFEYRLHQYACMERRLWAWLPIDVTDDDAMGHVLRLAARKDR